MIDLSWLEENYRELSKEEVKQLKIGTTYFVYNHLTNSIKEELASPIDIVHNKYCYDKLRYFIKE